MGRGRRKQAESIDVKSWDEAKAQNEEFIPDRIDEAISNDCFQEALETQLPPETAGKVDVGISLLGQFPTPSILLYPPFPEPQSPEMLPASTVSFAGSATSTCTCSTMDEDYLTKVQSEDKEERRRKKKARQKEKRRAKRLALERKRSLHDFYMDQTFSSSSSFIEMERISRALFSSGPSRSSGLESVALHKCPRTTMKYFFKEIPCILLDFCDRFYPIRGNMSSGRENRFSLGAIAIMAFGMGIWIVTMMVWFSTNDPNFLKFKAGVSSLAYWTFLGILSSVGLGTGLHTFVLYLGPFIAKVTMAAEECATLNFPEPPYPNQIVCPSEVGQNETPSMLSILSKVRWESLAWGFGTALGELPPYFVARTARLTGNRSSLNENSEETGLFENLKDRLQQFIMKVGFWGILLCASIPNPLFDLAGITCGHFLVPFTTFFGATVIGKSLIKSQLQTFCVILAFSEKSFEALLDIVAQVPFVGQSLQISLGEFVEYQRSTIRNDDNETSQSGGTFKICLDLLVFSLILYFLCSIINSMARSYYQRTSPSSRMNLKNRKKKSKKDGIKKRSIF